jgi:hypothetical protein
MTNNHQALVWCSALERFIAINSDQTASMVRYSDTVEPYTNANNTPLALSIALDTSPTLF